MLLRDILSGKDSQVSAIVTVIARNAPDIIALQGIDWDLENAALTALQGQLAEAGLDLPYSFARKPNSGLQSDQDLDGDGRRGGPADAQGFGRFTGSGGIAVLSRFPIETEKARDFTDLMWADKVDAQMPRHPDGSPFPSKPAWRAQRLSSTAHWVVPVVLPDSTTLSLLTFQAGPPVFDGPEDRNGKRNHDEISLWGDVLDGHLGDVPDNPIVLGGANLDPHDGEGRHEAITQLLRHPLLQDPEPESVGATVAPSEGHTGPHALDTVDWPRVGRFRVDYVVPGADWRVQSAGVDWPANKAALELVQTASRHRLVWVDLLPPLQ